jgi:hypothetical protein
MPQFDGAVLIQTGINTAPFDKGLRDIARPEEQRQTRATAKTAMMMFLGRD